MRLWAQGTSRTLSSAVKGDEILGNREGKLPSSPSPNLAYLFFHIYLFIWLCWVLVAAHGINFPDQVDQTQAPCIGTSVLAPVYQVTKQIPSPSP